MKHNSLFSANGLLHNPLASTTIKSSFLTAIFKPLLMLFLLVIVGTNAAWADNITFQGTEIFYFDKSSNSGWGTVVANDADVYLEFANSGNNATKSSAAQWEVENSILKVTVPSGTYNQVRIVRGQKGNPSSIWNTFSWINLQSGKNQILYGGSWDTYGGGGGDPSPIETHYIAGEGWSGSTWAQKDLTMTALGSDMAYYFIPAEKITGQIKFKLNPESSNSGWDKQLNSNAIDNSQTYSNIKLTSVDDQRMTISTTITGDKKNDIYVFTNGTKVWAIAVPIFSSQLPNENTAKPYTRMDLRLNDDNNEWKNYETATRFTDKADNDNSYTKHTLAYIIPAVGSGETDASGAKVRIEYYDGSKNCKKSNKDPGIAITSSPKRAIVLWDGSSTSPADPLIVDYPLRKSGWKVYVNGSLAGTTDANGDVLVSNLSAGDVTFYLTNGETSKLYQGINWFGGLYIKRSACSGVSLGEQQYGKGSGKNGVYKKPIVASYNPTGKFTLSQASDVTFNFDGGDITITATEPTTPPTTYTVTLHPNNGGASTIVKENVPEGSTTSAAALNLAEVTYGLGTATWYTNPECTAPFSTVTGNMDLYAKWGVSGNYWLVGDQWMFDTGSSWNNGENPAFTTTDGVATVTFIAPMGRNRFEIIKDNQWGQKINNGTYAAVVNSASPVAISVADGHMEFTLDEMKKVTIIYDGKVSVRAEAYDIHKTGWNIAGNSGLVGQEWNNSACPMDNNGEKILRNINTGNYEFKITPVGGWGIAAVNQFSAANVDKDNSTSNIFRNWTSHLFGSYKDGNEYKLPMNNKKDRNVCIQLTNDMAINGKADIKIAFDGAKITVNVLPKYTVTFNSNEGSDVASQTVFEGNTASEPSAPTKAGHIFSKWQLNGSDYNFSNPVTGNITLDAVWAYKDIESVSLNESTHMTWVGNTDFSLTPTLTPSDAIAKSVAWSSNATGVATVSDGTVHAVAVGEARITCTVTDQFDQQVSAYCNVTVAACEMATENLYSMTVTGYNSKTGDNADLSGLWNESTDNDGPATFRIVKLKLYNNYYVYDDNGTVKMSTDASLATAQWYEIPTGETYSPNWTGSSFALYEFKNVSTGRYMRRGNGRYGNNGDWYYYTTLADSRTTDGNIYKFFYDNTMGTHLVCREGADYNEGNTITELKKAFAIHNYNLYWADGYSGHCAAPMVICGYTNDPQNNAYTKLHETVVVDPSYPNPNYKASQMNSSYYRMKADATVQANLAAPLVSGAVITVRLYADANTTVKLQKTDGTEIETINLTADTEREYTYTVAYGSALVGATAFIIKAADNHAGIASIVVARTYAASPSDPALEWETDLSGGVTRSVLSGTFQHIASSTLSIGTIHYISSDETVATVAANGTVTPLVAGNTTITATIEAEGCYGEASITYNVTLTEASLQEAINATAASGTLTLTHNYNDDAVIDKAITINGGGHTIGDLKIENTGDLTLSSGLTVRDFTICAKAGNTTTSAASGQVRNAANLTCSRNAYFLYTVDPSGQVHYGWYDFTVPFPVNVMTGIKGIQDNDLNEDFVNERDYAIMEYLGERKAQGQYPYQKFRGVMQPNQLYSITLDSRYNYNTVRFQKTVDGALVTGNDVTLNAYAGSGIFDNLNGVGNGTLHHADAGNLSVGFVQVYQSGEKTFLTVEKGQYSFVVGTAFMVQETGTMTLNQATHDQLLAPARQASAPATAIQIAREGQPFSDQLFISASETGGQAYTPGTDLAKAGDLGSANVPQIWTNAYNNPLCVHEAQLVNGEASYNLSIYAPAADTYTLTSQNIPADYSLYLTQNGTMLTELSGTYTLDLNKGITTEYGLLLVETYKTPTGMEEPMSQESRVKSQKILRGGVLYILHNGKIYNAQGGKVCDL